MNAYANLRKALASPISKMANMSAEQCGKRAYIENGEVNSKCDENEWFCALSDFLCVMNL